MGHFLHFLIPGITLGGGNRLTMGSLALHSRALRLLGCLKAIIGGAGNISNIFLSLVKVLQCLTMMFDILGNLGLYVRTKITHFVIFVIVPLNIKVIH